MTTWREEHESRVSAVDSELQQSRSQLADYSRQMEQFRVTIDAGNRYIAEKEAELEAKRREIQEINSLLAETMSRANELFSRNTTLERERSQLQRDEEFIRETQERICQLKEEKEQFTSRIMQTSDPITRKALDMAARELQRRIEEKEQYLASGPADLRLKPEEIPNNWGAPLSDWSAVH